MAEGKREDEGAEGIALESVSRSDIVISVEGAA